MISNSKALTLGSPPKTIVPHKLFVTSEQKIPPMPPFKGTLSIQNPSDVPVNYTDCYKCAVFSLKKVAGKDTLGLNVGLVTGAANPDSCSVTFFDVSQGQFDAVQLPSEATTGILRVKTDGDPILVIQDRASTDPPQTVTLRSPAVVFIHNHGSTDVETNDDFLLNYLAADEMLSPDKVPDKANDCPKCTGHVIGPDLGPGCSNSNYP
jgi:hypothetical protein